MSKNKKVPRRVDSKKTNKQPIILYTEIIIAAIIGAITIYNFFFIQLPIGRLEKEVKGIKDQLDISQKTVQVSSLVMELIKNIIPDITFKIKENELVFMPETKELVLTYSLFNNSEFTCAINRPKIEIGHYKEGNYITMSKMSYSIKMSPLGIYGPKAEKSFLVFVKFKDDSVPKRLRIKATFPVHTHKKIVDLFKRMANEASIIWKDILSDKAIDNLSEIEITHIYEISNVDIFMRSF